MVKRIRILIELHDKDLKKLEQKAEYIKYRLKDEAEKAEQAFDKIWGKNHE